jgi:phosphatidylserine/phosphatidylglycerophosphate/cardiolipin synthase-like enzyme
VVRALKRADERGVLIRILLDPNKDAFGRTKNGIPNRQVADELVAASSGNTEIRWCATHGEQCHSKLLLIRHGEEEQLFVGSANFTRRNLDNFNLETMVRVVGKQSDPVIADAYEFFDTQWENRNDRLYSAPYATYAERNYVKTLWYRIGEFTGLSTY